MDYSYAPDDKVDLEHGYALLYEVETFDNDDGTTQYGYQVDLYPNWDDYGYSMYLSASNDGGGILMTMKYDDIGYPDGNTLQYGYQVDLYPNWDDYGYSMYLSASNDGGGILMTMKYDDIGYPDGNTLRSWSRPGAQDI